MVLLLSVFSGLISRIPDLTDCAIFEYEVIETFG